MTEPKRTELSVERERAILISALLPNERDNESPLTELRKLAKTAGANVIDSIVQIRTKKEHVNYLGKGKTLELAALCSKMKANVIICDHDLNPSQVKNLEKITETKVVDRSELILNIFATHARTRQAKLQVEVAQLEYMLPRLRHLWNHLERIEGGIGMRGGPGEKQLELDKRIASKKIQDLKKRLLKIEKVKREQISSRKDFAKISLVGYTNAGKSTLMNCLTGAGVLVEDKLFSTLDTKTKDLNLSKGKKILLSDTVGFIRRLPHHLISSFNATLEEARQADLLLHVVDVSAPCVIDQIKSVNKALNQLGCNEKPTLMVLNKIDILNDLSSVPVLKKIYKDCVAVSAHTGEGIEDLKKILISTIFKEYQEIELVCDNTSGKFIAYIFENIKILHKQFEDNKIHFCLMVDTMQLNKLRKLHKEIYNIDLQLTPKTRIQEPEYSTEF